MRARTPAQEGTVCMLELRELLERNAGAWCCGPGCGCQQVCGFVSCSADCVAVQMEGMMVWKMVE